MEFVRTSEVPRLSEVRDDERGRSGVEFVRTSEIPRLRCHDDDGKEGRKMLEKISDFPITVYLAISGFVRDMKKDDRGLSGVVVAILLILIAVLAIILIWGFLSGWLAELWERIVGETAEIT